MQYEVGVDIGGTCRVAADDEVPVHACALARALGMTRVIVPLHPGALSASGLSPRADRGSLS